MASVLSHEHFEYIILCLTLHYDTFSHGIAHIFFV